ncbi:MAG TPA: glycerol-3-phosphate 1-O-acyltransferase PlsY [Opitutaceae bacterium]|nr:glycerol-3-phosphate 1-O-acyltransferase PlsY [Opitutaceae bacterium]
MNLFIRLAILAIPAVTGYLLGALPFGYLIARAKGVNIFEVGSKSSGATNVVRVLGKGPGYLVFFLDVLKGVVATWLGGFIFSSQLPSRQTAIPSERAEDLLLGLVFTYSGMIVGLVAAIIGHSFSCFIKFRGGKGVATATGGFLVLLPIAALIAGVVWIIAFYASRYVSLASIIAAIALPAAAFFLHEPPFLQYFALLIAVLVILRHRANIVRLLNGTENKFVKKKENDA